MKYKYCPIGERIRNNVWGIVWDVVERKTVFDIRRTIQNDAWANVWDNAKAEVGNSVGANVLRYIQTYEREN